MGKGAILRTVFFLMLLVVLSGFVSGDVIDVNSAQLSTTESTAVDAFADASLTEGVVTLIADKFSTDDWSASEARITIDASEVGITTLNDLVNMSWDVNVVSGYIAHVDVLIDTNADDIADDGLVFEAAKVDPTNCELNTPYPLGVQDTLGRGIVEDSAYAWLSSGDPGPTCTANGNFYTNTLSNWKVGYQGISGTTAVLRFEIEVDPWIADSNSEISNIVINGVNYYISIQDAIDGAQEGDIINVAAGTYNENLIINKALTIQGANRDTTIIDGKGMLGPGVHITANDVTFQGFTITDFTCTPYIAGVQSGAGIGAIWVVGNGTVIDDNIIYNIISDHETEPAGLGIDVAASNVEVTNNIVHDVESIGIRVRSDYEEVWPGDTLMTGILVENNTVYNTHNSGVLVAGVVTDVTIKGNEIYNSLPPTPYGLLVVAGASAEGVPNNVLIEGNTIYGSYGNVCLGSVNNIIVIGNTISGAIPHYSDPDNIKGKNIYIRDWTGVATNNVNITNNNITNADDYGVYIMGNNVDVGTITINFNNISSNIYGIENTIETDVDATYNYWGHPSGPGGVGPGTGDAISDNVLYSPWMNTPFDVTPDSVTIVITDVNDYTNDLTPTLTLTPGANIPDLMAFSCNNIDYTSDIVWATTYDLFDLRSGSYGCTDIDELKTVYVKVKDYVGNENVVHNSDTVTLDTIIPSLTSVIITGAYDNGTHYLFSPANQDGVYDDVTITMTSSEIIENWVSVKITKIANSSIYKYYYPSGDNAMSLIQLWDGSLSQGVLEDGLYNISVKMTDYASNTNTTYVATVYVENTKPIGTVIVDTNPVYESDLVQVVTVTYDKPMNPSSMPTITFTGNTGVITTQDDGVWSVGNTVWTETFDVADADEENTVTVESSEATDVLGNVEDTSVSTTFDIDTIAPTLDYVSPTESSGVFRSQDYIEVNVTAPATDLDSIVIKLYDSTNNLINSATTTSSPNYINFLGLSDGIYYYNATANDTLGQEMSLGTRTITLDTENPDVIVNSPLTQSYTTDSILFNITATESNVVNACWYSLNAGSINVSLTNSAGDFYTNTNSSMTQGSHTVNYYCDDTLGNLNNTEQVTFFIDSIVPIIEYTTGTENNDTYFSRDWIFVNVSVTEINEDTITFSLYNSLGLVNETSYTDFRREINWIGLPNEVYYYDVSVNDSENSINQTETRTITLDTLVPEITITDPQSIDYTTDSLQINFIVSDDNALNSCWYTDNDGATNHTLTGCANTTYASSQGTTTMTLYAKDIAGNENSDSVTFFVDSISPNIVGFSPSESTPVIRAGESQQFSITTSGNTLTYEWFVNSVLNSTAETFTFTSSVLVVDDFNISVVITDILGNTAFKEWLLIVTEIPVARTFTGGETTDLSQVADISAVVDFTLATAEGKISFGDEVLDLSNVLDLDNNVKIEDGIVAINTVKYSELNKPANITLTGLSYTTVPEIFYNTGFTTNANEITSICDFCNIISYTPSPTSGGTVVFEVEHFSSFKVGGSGEEYDLDLFDDLDTCDKGIQGNLEITIKDPDEGDEFKPGEEIEIEVKVKNNADEDKDVIVEVALYNIDKDDEEESVESNDEEIEAGERETFELNLEIPENIEEQNDYLIFVKAYEEDEESTQCNQEIVGINIEREEHEVIIKNLVLNPQIVYQGKTIDIFVEVQNIGSDDEDDVYISVESKELGISERSELFDIEEYDEDDDFSSIFNIEIPLSAEEGEHELKVRVTFDDGFDEKIETFYVAERVVVVSEPILLADWGVEEVAEPEGPGIDSIDLTETTLPEQKQRLFAGINLILIIGIIVLIALIISIIILGKRYRKA